ncbi:MAG: DNA-packaging protein [Oscillospiraceae bacterium]|nr:DNA-packaging protein [Oscillospiraceae bacterium]
MAGRKRRYGTANALARAVDAYFAAISYEIPAVVATPTGAVDEKGNVEWKTIMLREKTKDPGMGGDPIVTTKWLRPPSMAGLMLHLGISKETWSSYAGLDGYSDVVERARARMEDYWITRLHGKGAQGAKFALSCCYGWREGADNNARGEEGVQIIDDL